MEAVMTFSSEAVAAALRKSWSIDTSKQWTAENPAAGQCNVTALLVFDAFGGEILKTILPEGDHFYNRIDGVRYDFTESQFEQPIAYVDIPTDRRDAERGTTKLQLAALNKAFQDHFGSSA
jgi:hypothetical protein